MPLGKTPFREKKLEGLLTLSANKKDKSFTYYTEKWISDCGKGSSVSFSMKYVHSNNDVTIIRSNESFFLLSRLYNGSSSQRIHNTMLLKSECWFHLFYDDCWNIQHSCLVYQWSLLPKLRTVTLRYRTTIRLVGSIHNAHTKAQETRYTMPVHGHLCCHPSLIATICSGR